MTYMHVLLIGLVVFLLHAIPFAIAVKRAGYTQFTITSRKQWIYRIVWGLFGLDGTNHPLLRTARGLRRSTTTISSKRRALQRLSSQKRNDKVHDKSVAQRTVACAEK